MQENYPQHQLFSQGLGKRISKFYMIIENNCNNSTMPIANIVFSVVISLTLYQIRFKFAFKVFDEDDNGAIMNGELTKVLCANHMARVRYRGYAKKLKPAWSKLTKTVTEL